LNVGCNYYLEQFTVTAAKLSSKYMKNGISEISVKQPSHRSTKKYLSLASSVDPNTRLRKKVNYKSESRFAAENSLISAVRLLLVICGKHYNVGKEFGTSNVPSVLDATVGARKLETMLSNYYGEPVFPNYQQLITTTDDTVNFIFEGISTKASSFFLVGKSQDSGTHSHHSNETGGTDHKNGLRIRNTVSFSGHGSMAPFCATVYGQNSRELSEEICPNGVLIIPITGFCAGGSRDSRIQAVGYIAFIRSKTKEANVSAEGINFAW
jgi:hypothetical protein